MRKLNMATSKPVMLQILDDLAHPDRFTTHPMFGEYALHADGKTVGFICDGALLVKDFARERRVVKARQNRQAVSRSEGLLSG